MANWRDDLGETPTKKAPTVNWREDLGTNAAVEEVEEVTPPVEDVTPVLEGITPTPPEASVTEEIIPEVVEAAQPEPEVVNTSRSPFDKFRSGDKPVVEQEAYDDDKAQTAQEKITAQFDDMGPQPTSPFDRFKSKTLVERWKLAYKENPDLIFTSGAYESKLKDISYKQRLEAYEWAVDNQDKGSHPNRPEINGFVVPAPVQSEFSESLSTATTSFLGWSLNPGGEDTPVGKALQSMAETITQTKVSLVEGLVGGYEELTHTALLSSDYVNSLVWDSPEMAKRLKENYSAIKPDGMFEEIVNTFGTLLGAGGFLKAAKGAAQIGKTVAKTATTTAKPSKLTKIKDVAKFEFVFTMMATPREEVGAVQEILDFVGVDNSDTPEVVKSKLNIFAEGLLLGGAGSLLLAFSRRVKDGIGGKVLLPIGALFKDNKYVYQAAVAELFGGVLKHAPKSLPEGKIKEIIFTKLPEFMEIASIGASKNIEGLPPVLQNIVKKGATLDLTTAQAVSKLSRGEVNILQKKLGAIAKKEEKASPSVKRTLRKEKLELQDQVKIWEMLEVNVLRTEEAAVAKYDLHDTRKINQDQDDLLKSTLKDGREVHGDIQSTERLVDAVRNSIDTELDNLRTGQTATQDTIDDIVSRMGRDGSEFSKVLDEVIANTVPDKNMHQKASLIKVEKVLKQVWIKMAKKQDAKYEAFHIAAESTPLDQSFLDLVSDLPDEALKGFGKGVKERVLNKEMGLSEAYKTFIPVITKNVQSLTINPTLAGNVAKDSLIELSDNLKTTQFDKLIATGSPDLAKIGELGKEAVKYSRDEYQSLWSTSKKSKLGAMAKQFKLDPENPKFAHMDSAPTANAQTEVRKTLGQVLKENAEAYLPHIQKVLEEGGDPEGVTRYLRAKAAEAISYQINSGKGIESLSKADFSNAFNGVIGYGDVVRKELTTFYKQFAEAQGSKEVKQAQLDKLIQEGFDFEQKMQATAFKKFYTKVARNGDINNPTLGVGSGFEHSEKTAREVMSDILKSPDSMDTLKHIKKEMLHAGDIVALEGAKSAYYRRLDEILFNKEGVVFNQEEGLKLLDDRSVLRDQGHLLFGTGVDKFGVTDKFGDDRALVDFAFAMSDEITDLGKVKSYAQETSSVKAPEVSTLEKSGLAVVNAGITITLGILNSLATVTKLGAKSVAKLGSPQDRFGKAVGEVFAHPAEFKRMLEILAEKGETPETISMFRQFFTKGIRTNMEVGDDPYVDPETENMFSNQ